MKKYPDRLFDDISDPDSGLYKDEGNDALDKFCSTDDSKHQGDVNVRKVAQIKSKRYDNDPCEHTVKDNRYKCISA